MPSSADRDRPERSRDQRPLLDIFDEVVEDRGDAVAVLDDRGRRCTYAQLRNRAAVLAADLARAGAGPGELVAICLPNSLELVTAQLAVLIAGGAYVPVDPNAPRRRRALLVDDARAAAVVADVASWADRQGGEPAGTDPVLVPLRDVAELDERSASFSAVADAELAYVMYTSGSTGEPKGVVVRRDSIVNLVVDCSYAPLHERPMVAMCAPAAFDASTFEVWGPLLNGGSVCIMTSPILSRVGPVLGAMAGERPTVLFLTTALFQRLAVSAPHTISSIDCLLFGGERCNAAVVAEFRERFDGELVHVYGPTEATTFATAFSVPRRHAGADGAASSSVPVGRPLDGVTIEVWDPRGGVLGPGEEGEVVIGGRGVADGYLGRPDLTSERFLVSAEDGSVRWYRTGDVGRLDADGALELIGRLDDQVKVRGHRIEPGEIEVAITAIPGVLRAAVVVRRPRDEGEASLAAFVVGAAGLSVSRVREHLSEVLPSYLVPPMIRMVDELPLSAAGKVDRAALLGAT